MEPARTISLTVNRNRRVNRPGARLEQDYRQTPHRRALRCSQEEEDIMAEELLQVLHCAASKIQALWRGYCTRKQLYIEQGAAVLLQAFWRGCLTRRLLRESMARPLCIHGQSERLGADPKPRGAKWAQDCGHPAVIELNIWPDPCANQRPEKQLCRLVCQDRIPTGQGRSRTAADWFTIKRKFDLAATIIQAFWRGYLARRDLAVRMGAAVYIQAFYRGYLVRKALNPTPEPQSEPEDEEAEMVSFNNSFSQPHSRARGPAPGGPWNHRTFRIHNSVCWTPSFSRPKEVGSLSAKGDTRQAPRTGYVPSYRLAYGQRRSPLDWLSTNEGNPKVDRLVLSSFSKGAGDTRCSVGVVSCPAPLSLECATPLKERQVDGLLFEEAAAGAKSAGCLALGVELPQPLPVSQYPMPSTPARKLVRYRDQLAPLSWDSQQTDFHLSDLEVRKDTAGSLFEPPPRRSLKRLQEESAAASTIQAAWKGLCARRALQEQAVAATKIQALFRSYQTRREFESKGIYPLVRDKAVRGSRSRLPCPGTVPAARQRAASSNVQQTLLPTVTCEQETPVFTPPCTSGEQVQEPAGCWDTCPDHLEHRALRCVSARPRPEARMRAATLIQAAWRGYRARRELAGLARAAAKIQALYRGYQVRKFLARVGRCGEGARESRGCGSREPGEKAGDLGRSREPGEKAGDLAEHQSAMWEQAVDEATSGSQQEGTGRRGQLKIRVPAILVKCNACYNPRRVTIHVKASVTDSS